MRWNATITSHKCLTFLKILFNVNLYHYIYPLYHTIRKLNMHCFRKKMKKFNLLTNLFLNSHILLILWIKTWSFLRMLQCIQSIPKAAHPTQTYYVTCLNTVWNTPKVNRFSGKACLTKIFARIVSAATKILRKKMCKCIVYITEIGWVE